VCSCERESKKLDKEREEEWKKTFLKKLKASIESRRRDQGSISSTFYAKLLCTQIPKVQKKTNGLTVFFALLGSGHVKAACKMLVKSTPGEMISTFFITFPTIIH